MNMIDIIPLGTKIEMIMHSDWIEELEDNGKKYYGVKYPPYVAYLEEDLYLLGNTKQNRRLVFSVDKMTEEMLIEALGVKNTYIFNSMVFNSEIDLATAIIYEKNLSFEKNEDVEEIAKIFKIIKTPVFLMEYKELQQKNRLFNNLGIKRKFYFKENLYNKEEMLKILQENFKKRDGINYYIENGHVYTDYIDCIGVDNENSIFVETEKISYHFSVLTKSVVLELEQKGIFNEKTL